MICSLSRDPLDLVEAGLNAPTIIELRRAGRGTICHRCGLFQRAAILEIETEPSYARHAYAIPHTAGANYADLPAFCWRSLRGDRVYDMLSLKF